jgi:hypothetical protein
MKVSVIGLILAVACTTACSAHYTEADVARIDSQIKSDFEQKGFVVDEVNMIKDADRHMKGYAKVRKLGLFTSNLQINKNCTATMDTDSRNTLLECK